MAGKIPQDFIDQLIARVDIVELIDARVPLKKTGNNYTARCPFHNEKTASFSVSRQKQFFYCFGCGVSGSAIGFLMDYDHLGYVEAIEELATSLGMDVPREGSGTSANRVVPKIDLDAIYRLQQQVADYYAEQLRRHPQAESAVRYLKGRGIDGEVAKTYRLGFAPPGSSHLTTVFDSKALLKAGLLGEQEGGGHYDRFRNRIMFPIRDRRARVVGFGGRVLGDGKPKYLNSPETAVFHKSHQVYGLPELLEAVSKPKRIIVVEGYMDVIALAQQGVPYAVATLGTATSKEHFNLLFRYTVELALSFDGDQAGEKAAWRAVENALPCLRDGRRIRIMRLPKGEDPDSIVRQEGGDAFEQRIEQSALLSDYFFDHLASVRDLSTIEGRAGLVEVATPLLQKLPEGAFRTMMQARLSELGAIQIVEHLPARQPVSFRQRRGQLLNTPVRVAIALLLQHPQLVESVTADRLSYLNTDAPGEKLLTESVIFFNEHPAATVAGLIERYRGAPEEGYLKQLAQHEVLISERGVEAEFLGALAQISRKHEKDHSSELINSTNFATMSDVEKERIRKLFNPDIS